MRILDLFCGCGGFALGFLLADPKFKISLAIDNDFRTMRTYTANIDIARILTKDIQNIHSYEILEQMNPYTPDIIIASPPCESFSAANVNRKKTSYDQLYSDEKGRLILDTIRLIIDLEPSIFIIENVSQLRSTEMQEFIRHEFSRSSYESIFFNSLEALNCGVPSYRQRVFISNLLFNFSNKNVVKTTGEAFKSLPAPSIDIHNHLVIPIPSNMVKKIPRTPPGGAMVYFRGSQTRTFRNYIRLQVDQPSPTVMGKSRFIHPFEARLCTVREHARLMSYPDNFQFYGPIDSQYNQVGESVPPLMARVVAQQILTDFPKNSKKVF
ncbi:MAG: DNA cytosine methyltransferase [Candidatus Heimdallarchaeota archaeon]|nr:MAG: DNA cytosine methyltransferase [Candidatus Heimdallarchaeota archaeon]